MLYFISRRMSCLERWGARPDSRQKTAAIAAAASRSWNPSLAPRSAYPAMSFVMSQRRHTRLIGVVAYRGNAEVSDWSPLRDRGEITNNARIAKPQGRDG